MKSELKFSRKIGQHPIFRLFYMKSVRVLGWRQTHSSVP
jgi:hypothetical protein